LTGAPRAVSVSQCWLLTFIVIGVAAQDMAAQSLERTGDVLQVLIPTTALATTAILDDIAGGGQFLLSFTATAALTHSLKVLVDKERPNGVDTDSFPSGHTSAAFQGAAFIHFRYGLQYALPAYAGASLVAFTRVHTGKHDIPDVLAGAALAIGLTAWTSDRYIPLVVTPAYMGDSLLGFAATLAVR
jgi:membrane-associated phospholipid phosphatase